MVLLGRRFLTLRRTALAAAAPDATPLPAARRRRRRATIGSGIHHRTAASGQVYGFPLGEIISEVEVRAAEL